VKTLDYDTLAGDYARHRRTYPGLVEHILEHSGVTAGSVVLEVGCGTANHLAAVRRATAAHCVGVEPSEQMLREAEEHPEELELRRGNAEDLDVEAGAFDLVMSVDMIHHVRAPERYIERAFAALKPGGFLVTVTDSDWVIRNRVPLARYFPGTLAAEFARYHTVPTLSGYLALTGFDSLYERVIESDYTLRESSSFRDKSYSCLHLIGDEEFAAGLAALDADLAKGPLAANLRSLALWGRRPA
jgi:ubiquinone/menaquinone biosynthesis C-methylase UbiE